MKSPVIKQKSKWKSDQRFADADTKNFRLIFYAFVVGVVAGTIGSVFRLTLEYIEVYRDKLYASAGDSGISSWIWPILFGIIGITVALFLVKRFAPEASGSGVQEIEGALDEIRPMRWKRILPIKFIASLFSLGSGLLLGREGPTIQIGANVGRMIKDIFKQPDNKTNPLVSSGAAAGLACAFNAPFAGIIFVIEEMHGHFRYTFFSVAAIMVASGTSDFVVRALVGADPVIKMTIFPRPEMSAIWLFIVLGLFFSLIGYSFNKLLIIALNFFSSLSRIAFIFSGILAGIVIVIIGAYFPEMIGGGYRTISQVLNQSFTLSVLIVLFVGRMLMSIFSYGTGVPGGIFAPMLAIGVVFGMLFGSVVNYYFPDLVSHPGIFAVAGMAGIFASTVRAPLTGLVLAVEMTANYELILPLIITTVTASVVTAQLGNEPIYTTLLKRTLAMEKSQLK
ncbi:MAG: H(+)/Cl(-) exchange transporter ClcA [Bacteroidetes bacterium]|nr:H(+)/Cl(-) exchange transporter ClcA [Bacteroidota bacterium]